MTRIRQLFCAAALAMAAAGCSTLLETKAGVADIPLTAEDETALGLQIHNELLVRNVRLARDPVVVGYVENLFGRLTRSDTRKPDAPWHLHVIDDLGRAETFSTSGGHVYVYTGLLLAAGDEAEVTAGLGHELGHAVSKHTLNRMVSAYGAPTMARLVKNDPAALAEIATVFANDTGRYAHSEDEEMQADTFAIKLTAQAGYAPRAIERLFGRLQARNPGAPWLRTHPVSSARVANVNLVVAREHLLANPKGRDGLPQIKRRLEQGAPVSSAGPLPDLERAMGEVAR